MPLTVQGQPVARLQAGFCIVALALLLSGVPVRAAENWVKVASPHFTVFTTARPAAARNWAMELERFRVVLQETVSVPESRLRPVTVVLFPNEKAMQPFLPLRDGKPQKLAGFFVHFGDSHAIGLALDGKPAEIRRTVFHEVVHWCSNAGGGELPVWLEEGVAEVYSTFSATPDGQCSFGEIIPEHVRLLGRKKGWSVEQLVTTGQDSVDYNEQDRASVLYASSWLATHYLLFGSESGGRDAILRYLEARQHTNSPAHAFKAGFGVGYAEFQARLVDYLKHGKYRVHRSHHVAGEIERTLASVPASTAEVRLALATLLIGARPDQSEAALPWLHEAARLEATNPSVWQVLGERALLDKKEADAADYLARALACGSTSYFVHDAMARYRSREVGDPPDRSIVQEAMRGFRRAIELNPTYVPAYEGLAGLMFAGVEVDPADRARLEAGARLAPNSAAIDVGLAACELLAGKREAGRRRLGFVLEGNPAPSVEVRQLALHMLKAEAWNDAMVTLRTHFERQDYAEVIAYLDFIRDEFADPKYRTVLEQNRLEAVNFRLIGQAIDAANHGRKQDAVRLLRQVEGSGGSTNALAEATRLLKLLAP